MKDPHQPIQFVACCAVLLASALLSGCAPHHPSRRIFLHEYSATVHKADTATPSPLRGVPIAVADFTDNFDYNAPVTDKNVAEPTGYIFSNIATNPEQKKLWNREGQQRIKSSSQKDWQQIGYLRNLFGGRAQGVYVTVPPGAWLADTLKLDLAEQGAKLVPPEEATVTVRGTVRHLDLQMCFKWWGDLVVDVEITAKGKPTITRTIHTTPTEHTAAGSGSTFEAFKALRQCQQKFSAAMIDSLEGVVSAPASTGQ